MKKCFPIFLAAALLCGCAKDSGTSENSSEISLPQTAEQTAPPITSASTEKAEAPAGVGVGGGVSLTEDNFAEVKKLTDFSGEYVTLEESGLEYRDFVFPFSEFCLISSRGGRLCGYEGIKDSRIKLYDIESGETVFQDDLNESAEASQENIRAVYADEEYAVYLKESESALVIHSFADGTSREIYRSENFGRLYRVGKSFFFDVCVSAYCEEIDRDIEQWVVYRYYTATGALEIYEQNAKLLAASDNESVVYMNGEYGLMSADILNGIRTYFTQMSCEDYYSTASQNGDFPYFVSLERTDPIFGSSYEAGYYPRPNVRKTVFTTTCGSEADFLCAHSLGYLAAYIFSSGGDYSAGHEVIFDIRNKRAIVADADGLGCTKTFVCGDWLCFMWYTRDSGELMCRAVKLPND